VFTLGVGAAVEKALGCNVGLEVGRGEGCGEGHTVGISVGTEEGAGVGAAAGLQWATMTPQKLQRYTAQLQKALPVAALPERERSRSPR